MKKKNEEQPKKVNFTKDFYITHLFRISNRLGLVNKKSPKKIKDQLLKIVPWEFLSIFSFYNLFLYLFYILYELLSSMNKLAIFLLFILYLIIIFILL